MRSTKKLARAREKKKRDEEKWECLALVSLGDRAVIRCYCRFPYTHGKPFLFFLLSCSVFHLMDK
jgi:hypothetical protein